MLGRVRQPHRVSEPEPDATIGLPLPSLVVGLGNPGAAYAKHRHNVGAWALNRLAKALGAEFRSRSGVVELTEADVDGRRVVLARPRTFMNESGKAVQQALKKYGFTPEQMVVVYDDLDSPTGRIRIRAKGSHGGHNGLRSIVGVTGSQAFARLKIGIGRPVVGGEPSWDPEHVAAYVLAAPGPADRAALEDAADRAAEALAFLLREGVESAMQRYNGTG